MVKVVKLLGARPPDWAYCLQLGRVKFEKYFNHRVRGLYMLEILTHDIDFLYYYCICTAPQALKLLSAFPLDTKMKDGCELE